MKIIPILVATLMLLGCVSAMSPEQLARIDNLALCAAYDDSRAPNVRAELIRRNLLTDEEWTLIDQHKVRRGMSICALYASWGYPMRSRKSVGSWGVHIQHIYVNAYVYTENGIVTAWQR